MDPIFVPIGTLTSAISFSRGDVAERLSALTFSWGGDLVMGELLDRLNAMDSRSRAPGEPIRSVADKAAQTFRSASQRVNEAVDAVLEPGMPLDVLRRWTRRAPALAVACLIGVIVARRRP